LQPPRLLVVSCCRRRIVDVPKYGMFCETFCRYINVVDCDSLEAFLLYRSARGCILVGDYIPGQIQGVNVRRMSFGPVAIRFRAQPKRRHVTPTTPAQNEIPSHQQAHQSMGGQARCGARPASLDFKKCLRLMNGLFLRRKGWTFLPTALPPSSQPPGPQTWADVQQRLTTFPCR
jgi:hypothetical protein